MHTSTSRTLGNSRTRLWRALGWTTTAAALLTLGGCSFFGSSTPKTNPYANAYQVYESPCVIPVGEHSPTLDVMLMNAMKDRGLTPQLVEESDAERIKACRITVRFEVKGGENIAKGVENMSLFYRDHKSGETYWVGMGRQSRFAMPELGNPAANHSDPQVFIRQLVERLFPERLVLE